MSKPKTMMIDEVKYIREDSIKSSSPAINTDGLKYAICRSRNQGVMAGYVKEINGQCVELLSARQLWRWHSKFVLADLAEHGVQDSSRCKFSVEMSQPTLMLECCAVMYTTEFSRKSIASIEPEENE